MGEGSSDLIEQLSACVGRSHVLTSQADQLAYSRDSQAEGVILARGGRLMRHRPRCVVQPGSEEEVAAVLRVAGEAGVPVVPFGAGSGVCGGAAPIHGGVVVDVKRLSKIEAVDASGLLVRVGCGVLGMELETELLRRGLTLGHYPSSLYCSTLGGYLASRSAGQQSSRFGKIEDMVQTVRFVSGAGEVLDSAPGLGATRWGGGLDLTQLLVGSEGTLGVMTAATLRLHPAPAARAYRGWRCHTIEEGIAAQREIMQAGLRPCVMRLYDEFDTLIAGHGGGGPVAGVRRRSGEGVGIPDRLAAGLYRAARRAIPQEVGWVTEALPDVGARVSRAAMGLLGRAVGQPLLLNQLADALPGGCLLVVGFEGEAGLVREEEDAARAILEGYAFDLGPGPGEHWLENRFKVSYKQSPLFDAGVFVDTFEVAATWSNLTALYYSVRDAVAPHAFIMAHLSHAYPEGASIYFTFAGFGVDTDESLASYAATWQAAQEAVVSCGGTVSHHHGIGSSRVAYVGEDHRGGWPLFAALKAGLDPRGIMNPGKVWPVSEVLP